MNKVLLFNQTNYLIQNIISNCIPHENVTCGDRSPSWIDETIKKLVLHCFCLFKEKTEIFNDLFPKQCSLNNDNSKLH